MVNKFVPAWQIARVKARQIKDPQEKLESILDWFEANKSQQNYHRVINWVRMTALGYSKEDRFMFEKIAKALDAGHYQLYNDDTNLDNFSIDDLVMVYKDLNKRKYGFQFSKVPKNHIEFMKQLSTYLTDKGVSI